MPSIADLNAKLDAAGEGTQPFKPNEEGDQIAGRIVAVGSFTHPEYGTSPTLTFETDADSVVMDGKPVKDAGNMRTLMAGAVLGGAFSDNQIAVGDWVAIRYLGKKQGKATNPYKNYAVVVEKAPPVTATSKLDDASDFV